MDRRHICVWTSYLAGLAVAVIMVAIFLWPSDPVRRPAAEGPAAFPVGVKAQGVIGAKGGRVANPVGVVVDAPAGAFAKDVKVTVATVAPPRGGGALAGPVVEMKSDLAPDAVFARAVEVTIPFTGSSERALTAGYWNGRTWCPVGGRVDAKRRTVTFRTMSFSTYTVMIEDWSAWPEVTIDASDIGKEVRREAPRGAVFRLTVRGLKGGLRYGVKARFGRDGGPSPVQVASDGKTTEAFAAAGAVVVTDESDGLCRLTMLVHVTEGTPLGWHDLALEVPTSMTAGPAPAWPASIPKAIYVANRKVFILDIDGLRADVFREQMLSNTPPQALATIFGRGRGAHAEATLSLKKGGSVRGVRFPSGYLVDEAATIFPSYTFAGHAAIFTGRLPGQYGIPGNEWLDRRPADGFVQRRYAFTGAFADEGALGLIFGGRAEAADPLFSFWWTARANKMLRGPTVYDMADDLKQDLRHVVGFNMYLGHSRGMRHIFPTIGQQVFDYTLSTSGIALDRDMIEAVTHGLGLRKYGMGDLAGMAAQGPGGSTPYVENKVGEMFRPQLGIVTLYFASLDHSGHSRYTGTQYRNNVRLVHSELLQQHIDPMIGEFWKSLDELTRRNSLWIVVSDHGQTDVGTIVKPDLRDALLPSAGYKPEMELIEASNPDPTISGVRPRDLVESDTVVAWNGGSAHVYLRRDRDRANDWRLLPTDEQTLELARTILGWATTPAAWLGKAAVSSAPATTLPAGPGPNVWSGKIDLILLRRAKMRPAPAADPATDYEYAVLDPADGRDAKVVSVEEYLGRKNGVFYTPRYGWTISDKAFLAETLQGFNCDRSGDVVILPKYPDFHFESKDCPANHGGLVHTDMNCTLAAAIPGSDVADGDPVRALLEESIDLVRKAKPSNRDVPDITLNYFRSKALYRKSTASPLHLAHHRQGEWHADNWYSRNVLAVTGDPIAAYDATRDAHELEFTLHRAVSPEGPFVSVPMVSNDDRGEYAILHKGAEPGKNKGWAERGKVVLEDDYYEKKGLSKDGYVIDPGPFYYKARMVKMGYRPARQPLGPEVWSDVLGPGDGRLVAWNVGNPKDPSWFSSNSDGYGQLNVKLAASNYRWDCPGAEFTVTKDGWRGRFFSSRRDSKRLYMDYDGISSKGHAGESCGLVLLPYLSRPGEKVRIEAKGRGLSAALELELPPETRRIAEETKRFNEREPQMLKAKADMEKAIAWLQGELTKLQAELDRLPPDAARDRFWKRHRMMETRYRLATLQRVELPALAHSHYGGQLPMWGGMNQRGFALGVKTMTGWLEGVTARLEVEKQYVADRVAMAKEQQGLADTSASERESLGRTIYDLQAGWPRTERLMAQDVGRAHRDLARLLRWTGDPGGMRSNYDAAMRRFKQALSEYARATTMAEIQDNLRQKAYASVMLGGDRTEAARWWLLADKILADNEKDPVAAAREAERFAARPLPTWWPDDGKAIAPADLGEVLGEKGAGAK